MSTGKYGGDMMGVTSCSILRPSSKGPKKSIVVEPIISCSFKECHQGSCLSEYASLTYLSKSVILTIGAFKIKLQQREIFSSSGEKECSLFFYGQKCSFSADRKNQC